MEIKLISPTENQHGHFEYDFFPDRTFSFEKYSIIWPSECWENEKYLYHFKQCDEANIKVICFGSYNNIPIFSQICHKFIAIKCEFGFLTGKRTMSGLDGPWRTLFSTYNINVSDFTDDNQFFNMQNRQQRAKYFSKFQLWDYQDLAKKQVSAPIYMDKSAFYNFQKNKHLFNVKDQTMLIYKKHVYEYLFKKLNSDIGVLGYPFAYDILSCSGDDNFCSFQILLSLYNRLSYVAMGGAASYAAMCLPMNTCFASDYQWNVREFILQYKNAYNKFLYNNETFGFIHDHRKVFQSGWRYNLILNLIEQSKLSISPHINFSEV